MEWGGELKWMLDLAEETGRRLPPLERRVAPERHQIAFWRAFQTLSASRQYGPEGPGSISLADISAYCELCGLRDPDQRLQLCRIIQKMDDAYRAEVRRKNPPQQ